MSSVVMLARSTPAAIGRYAILAPLAQDDCFSSQLVASADDAGELSLSVLKTVQRDRKAAWSSLVIEEARRRRTLDHGNLVRIEDAGEIDGQRYIAQELVEGRDLRALLTRFARHQLREVGVGHLLPNHMVGQMGRNIPIEVSLFIMRDLCNGMQHAHAAGFLYGGLSPESVIVSWGGEVKLNDLGVGALAGRSWLSLPEGLRGRLGYLAPEQARNQTVDARADLWSVGVILWEMLAGRPLVDVDGDKRSLLARLASPKVPPLRRHDTPLSPGLQRILAQVLVADRDARISSAAVLRDELDRELLALAPSLDDANLAMLLQELWGDEAERECAQHQRLLAEATLRNSSSAPGQPRTATAVHPSPPLPLRATLARAGAASVADDDGPRATLARASVAPVADEGVVPAEDRPGSDRNVGASDERPGEDRYVGQLIDGRYRVDRLIGEGGMGRVYEVEHTHIGRRLALKVLAPGYSNNTEVVARFRREARAASLIGHPNIVEVTDYGNTADGNVYFVMERLEGCELAERMRDSARQSIADTVRMAVQICRALNAAHAAGIVHRDLKPENIFLVQRRGERDFVKILDFGIAQIPDGRSSRLTLPGVAMGTPDYMSPEQAVGGAVDARSDIYALGAILYEILSGATPHYDPTPMTVLIKRATEDARPLSEVAPEAPAWLARLVQSCLARDPAARPSSMGQLADALERGLQPAVLPVDELLRPPANDVQRRGRVSAHAWTRLLITLVVVMGAMLALLYWLSSSM